MLLLSCYFSKYHFMTFLLQLILWFCVSLMRFVTFFPLFILSPFCLFHVVAARGQRLRFRTVPHIVAEFFPRLTFWIIIISLESNRSCLVWWFITKTVTWLQEENDPLLQPVSPVNKHKWCFLFLTNYSTSALEMVADCCLCYSRPPALASLFCFSV